MGSIQFAKFFHFAARPLGLKQFTTLLPMAEIAAKRLWELQCVQSFSSWPTRKEDIYIYAIGIQLAFQGYQVEIRSRDLLTMFPFSQVI